VIGVLPIEANLLGYVSLALVAAGIGVYAMTDWTGWRVMAWCILITDAGLLIECAQSGDQIWEQALKVVLMVPVLRWSLAWMRAARHAMLGPWSEFVLGYPGRR